MQTRRFAFGAVAAAAFVLAGCASTPAPKNLADTLASTPSLSTLNGLVTKAGLTDTLKGTGPFTVFAPSNDAFKAVPAKTLDDLGKNPELLKRVLAYHVVAGKVMAADVKTANVKTLAGPNVATSRAGTFVTVEGAVVEQADVAATNGVVHVIDSVMLPPN
jgi:uncharacterized surface protein with fasciclin (FAS1) repeats